MSATRKAIVEGVLRHHLPIPLKDSGKVMCMCHANSSLPPAVFDGPVYHREHVAQLILRYLDAGVVEPHPIDPEFENEQGEPTWRLGEPTNE